MFFIWLLLLRLTLDLFLIISLTGLVDEYSGPTSPPHFECHHAALPHRWLVAVPRDSLANYGVNSPVI